LGAAMAGVAAVGARPLQRQGEVIEFPLSFYCTRFLDHAIRCRYEDEQHEQRLDRERCH